MNALIAVTNANYAETLHATFLVNAPFLFKVLPRFFLISTPSSGHLGRYIPNAPQGHESKVSHGRLKLCRCVTTRTLFTLIFFLGFIGTLADAGISPSEVRKKLPDSECILMSKLFFAFCVFPTQKNKSEFYLFHPSCFSSKMAMFISQLPPALGGTSTRVLA